MSSVVEYSLDFPLFFIIFDVWRWSEVVGSMDFIFDVRHEEHCMENIVNSPCQREFQPISNWSEDFRDSEGSFTFRGHLLVVFGFEVLSVKPNQLVQFESREFVFVSFGHASLG